MVASSNTRSCFLNRCPRLFSNRRGRFRNVRNPASDGLLRALETPRSSLQCVSSPAGSFRTLGSVGLLPPIPSPTLSGALLMQLNNRSPSSAMLSIPDPEDTITTNHATVDPYQLLSNTRLQHFRIKSLVLRGEMLSRRIQNKMTSSESSSTKYLRY